MDGNKKLIAVTSILYLCRMYKPGEKLPVNDPEMVEAWLEAGTAKWDDGSGSKPEASKAKPVTAEPGRTGSAVSSDAEDGEDLVGKVPETKARKKK